MKVSLNEPNQNALELAGRLRSNREAVLYPLRDLLAAFEATIIATALRASEGSQRRAAHALGLLPTTLQEKMKRHGLHEDWQRVRSTGMPPAVVPFGRASSPKSPRRREPVGDGHMAPQES